jgi:hypothetical protein
MELRKRMHDPIAKTGAWLNQMLKLIFNSAIYEVIDRQ